MLRVRCEAKKGNRGRYSSYTPGSCLGTMQTERQPFGQLHQLHTGPIQKREGCSQYRSTQWGVCGVCGVRLSYAVSVARDVCLCLSCVHYIWINQVALKTTTLDSSSSPSRSEAFCSTTLLILLLYKAGDYSELPVNTGIILVYWRQCCFCVVRRLTYGWRWSVCMQRLGSVACGCWDELWCCGVVTGGARGSSFKCSRAVITPAG